MNSKDMESICIIAEEGSVTRAAKRLFTAQSSLSQCIQRVEQEFGITLFVRTKSGIELTDAGHLFISSAEQIGKIYRDMENSFSDLNSLAAGHLVIGIPALLSSYLLPEFLTQFKYRYPNIIIEMLEAENNRLESLLQRGKIDLAISSIDSSNNFSCIHILTSDMVIIAPDRFDPGPAFDPTTNCLDLAILDGKPFIMPQKKQKLNEIVESIINKAGIKVDPVLYTSSSKGGILYSICGLGFTIQPEISYLFHKKLLDGRGKVYRIPDAYQACWKIQVKQSKDCYFSKAAQAFTHELCQFFAGYPESGPIHR